MSVGSVASAIGGSVPVSGWRAGTVRPMEQRPLGRSGLMVSRLALGTMTWGRDTDSDDAAAQLTAFVAAGGTLVDTADVYSGGDSERLLGELLDDVVARDEIVLATKAGVRPGQARRRDASRGHLLSALDASGVGRVVGRTSAPPASGPKWATHRRTGA